jgi:hypothetical protein
MPAIDLSILNQRQTPAFYADTLANRPSAGFVGRIFVSTDTFAFYRDNGTTWDLIGGPGTGTVTGTGAAGQVTYWNGASTITGTNNLFYDTANSRLGINTNVPGTALDVHNATNTILQLNQTVATNDTRIAFQNGGSSLWRIGNLYNAGANDFEIFDVVGSLQSLTVKKTTGQVLIGTTTVGSGKLVVSSTTGDNGVQIVGASAPSLRIDNAESGPTKRAGFGISTAANNFIQGSADRDFCMFNGSTTASPILFGIYGTTNVLEAARISAARNFLIGTTTDSGDKLQVNGTSYLKGILYVGDTTNGAQANVYASSYGNNGLFNAYGTDGVIKLQMGALGANEGFLYTGTGNKISVYSGANITATFTSSQNFLIGTTTDAGQKLQVNGDTRITGNILTNKQTGNNYPQTSTSGTTSIVDTSIFFNTSVLGYGQSAIYQVTITGNPQDGGSNAYRNIIFGYISVKTGFTGSVVQEIQWNEIFNNTATAFTPFVITVFFWNGTTESSTIANGTTNAQIRVKVTGYGGTVGAGGQEVTIYKIN